MRLLEKLDMKLLDPGTDWRQGIFSKIDIAVARGQKVLNIGCGDGGDALIFANLGAKGIGIDIASHKNWHKLENDNLKFEIVDSCNLPFKDKCFDLT